MNTAIKHLQSICVENGYDDSPAVYFELLHEGRELRQGYRDEHRHYTITTTVSEVDGMAIQWDKITMRDSDYSLSDAGIEHDLNQVFEVEPVVVKTIEYRIKQQQ